ncbi:MAG: hypothetical protein F6K30_18725 [Cyanothece sp. SIO2G6]|nr:hypothetical protein [Cyanothece sp. SIO2G6]
MKDKRSEKQKVTLYVPPDLHHKLKIRAALDCEPMSTIAERAIRFYLTHSDVVDSIDAECVHGHSHQVYSCPECGTNLVIREGELELIGVSSEVIPDVSPESATATVESRCSDEDKAESYMGTSLVHC